MNGAETLVKTLLNGGVDVCFANPGTSEMHFVAALDQSYQGKGMRCILKLFEGGVTGAADGYYRMSGKPAATLLHLGPGFANGWANLHNGRKAHSGIINIVGDHASQHAHYDAPLTSDIDGVINSVSHWVRRATSADSVAVDSTAAIQAAQLGQIASLILPADSAWGETDKSIPPFVLAQHKTVSSEQVRDAAERLKQPGSALFLGSHALQEKSLYLAGQIVYKTGCDFFTDFFNARFARGMGRVQPSHLTYSTVHNQTLLKDVTQLILVGANEPVAFFGYPDQPSVPTRPDCEIIPFAPPAAGLDLHRALSALAAELDATDPLPTIGHSTLPLPTGELTAETISHAIAALMPENSIIVDEAIALWQHLHDMTALAAPHDWLSTTGGAIGQALPCAVGAAVACPDRKVIALEGDGSAMYTIQSLWTMARENLDVLVVILANKGYQVLFNELRKMGIEPGQTATDLLEMDNPQVDWQAMAQAHGVESGRAATLDDFIVLFRREVGEKRPFLIEVTI